jgi:hypothetical protein
MVSHAGTTPNSSPVDGGDCLTGQHPGTPAPPSPAAFGRVFKEAIELLPGGYRDAYGLTAPAAQRGRQAEVQPIAIITE